MLQGFEQNLDPKEVRIKASKDWKSMEEKDKLVYRQKKKENDNFFEKAKKIKNVIGPAMYIQKIIENAKIKKEKIPTLTEVISNWKTLSASEKKKYEKYAQLINEERKKLKDIYELVNGIKPKRPCGAYKIFLQEKFKDKAIKNMDEGHKIWMTLNDDEKEKYLKKGHRVQLAYQYKKMIYNKKIRKMIPKKPDIYKLFIKEIGKKPYQNGREEFDKLTKEEKMKYEVKYIEEMKKYNEKMQKFKNYVFDISPAPINAFSLFMKDRLKGEKNYWSDAKVRENIIMEWKENEQVKAEYQKKVDENQKIFKKKLKDFHKLGYYIKNNDAYIGDDEERESTTDEEKNGTKTEKKKKRSNKKNSLSTTKTKKRNTKNNSLSTTKKIRKTPEKERQNSGKRTGKTQKIK